MLNTNRKADANLDVPAFQEDYWILIANFNLENVRLRHSPNFSTFSMSPQYYMIIDILMSNCHTDPLCSYPYPSTGGIQNGLTTTNNQILEYEYEPRERKWSTAVFTNMQVVVNLVKAGIDYRVHALAFSFAFEAFLSFFFKPSILPFSTFAQA